MATVNNEEYNKEVRLQYQCKRCGTIFYESHFISNCYRRSGAAYFRDIVQQAPLSLTVVDKRDYTKDVHQCLDGVLSVADLTEAQIVIKAEKEEEE